MVAFNTEGGVYEFTAEYATGVVAVQLPALLSQRIRPTAPAPPEEPPPLPDPAGPSHPDPPPPDAPDPPPPPPPFEA